MIEISGIMDIECIRLELNASKKEDAIRELLQLLADAGKIDGVDPYLEDVLEREKISSTGIGQGLAIPHRLVAGVASIMMAVGRKVKGVPFDSIDGKPAHLIFLIIGPQGRYSEYLKILSKLSRHLNDRSMFEMLMKAKNEAAMIELFRAREK